MKHRDNGFTLVEVAIVMLVSGILLTAAVRGYDLFSRDKERRVTVENIEAVNSAIALFQAAHDRFPCPARLTARLGDPDYGQEIDCSAAIPIVPPIGVDTVAAHPDRDPDDDPATPHNILIGGVPFVTLEMEVDEFDLTIFHPVRLDLSSTQILDGWGNKLTYAVSESLVQQDTFNDDLGVVSVSDEFDQSLVDPEHSAHFVVLSHGSNGRGAYTTTGVRIGNPCTGGSVTLPSPPAPPAPLNGGTTTIEYENCNGDELFISALRNDVPGNAYNDDIASFQLFISSDLWEFAPGPPGAPPTAPGSIVNKNFGNVGIGTDTPTEKLHVEGKLKAESSKSVRICSAAGEADCFEPGLLGGGANPFDHAKDTDPPSPDGLTGKQGMSCSDPTHAMIGIVDNKPVCASPFVGFGGITDKCDPGEYMIGIKSNNTVDCEPFN